MDPPLIILSGEQMRHSFLFVEEMKRALAKNMSDEDLRLALEPFRQVQTTRSTAGGTGLGLPLTKALVEANRANFVIDSKPQEGTMVEITFPSPRVLAE